MKKIILFFVITSSPLFCLCQNVVFNDSMIIAEHNKSMTQYLGKEVNNFEERAINGKKFSKKKLSGKITLINFWFEYCAPCIAEFEALNALYIKYKNNNKFQFISFTFESSATINRIMGKYALKFPIVCVSEEKCRLLNFNQGFPVNIITNLDGKIVFINSGGPTKTDDATRAINSTIISNLNKLLN